MSVSLVLQNLRVLQDDVLAAWRTHHGISWLNTHKLLAAARTSRRDCERVARDGKVDRKIELCTSERGGSAKHTIPPDNSRAVGLCKGKAPVGKNSQPRRAGTRGPGADKLVLRRARTTRTQQGQRDQYSQ